MRIWIVQRVTADNVWANTRSRCARVCVCYFLCGLKRGNAHSSSAAKRQLWKPRRQRQTQTNCCVCGTRRPAGNSIPTFGGNLRAHFAAAVRIHSEKRFSPTHTQCIYAKTLTLRFSSLDGLEFSQIWFVFQSYIPFDKADGKCYYWDQYTYTRLHIKN
jgi:hypothetical protein